MENKIITETVRQCIERELKNGTQLEMRLKTNKDGSEELVVYKKKTEKLNIE